jgi:DNA-binding response OmpR family regulator
LKVLLIEDEIKIAEFVLKGLLLEGFEVTHASDGELGLKLALTNAHDVLVLDLMLPKLSGLDLLQQFRQAGFETPVIILSAKVDLPDRLKGFDLGADDYLLKPFFVEELIARIKALTHRKSAEVIQVLTASDLVLDVVTRKAQWDGVSAILSQREFSLLAFLMRSPGYIFSRQQILKHVWNINFDPETNVVDVCVRRVKRKLSRVGSESHFPIESVRGVGYRFRMRETG